MHNMYVLILILLVASLFLFLITFGCQSWCGWRSYSQLLCSEGYGTISFMVYLVSPEFCSSNFQTWQAEFLTVAVFVCFSVFLREKDSAESKPWTQVIALLEA